MQGLDMTLREKCLIFGPWIALLLWAFLLLGMQGCDNGVDMDNLVEDAAEMGFKALLKDAAKDMTDANKLTDAQVDELAKVLAEKASKLIDEAAAAAGGLLDGDGSAK